MKAVRRLSARATQWLATHSVQVLAALIAAFFGWSALVHWHNLHGTPLDFASRVLSIISVGRITPQEARPFFVVWEIAIAVCLIWPRGARALLWLSVPRLILAILPLLMLNEDLQVAGEASISAYALLLLSALFIGAQRRWAVLQNEAGMAELVAPRSLSPRQRRKKQRQVLAGLFIALIIGGAGRAIWPTYLKWFHARQEAAVLDEKLSGTLVKKSMPLSSILHRKITTWVYLPPGYHRFARRYPVIYVMHGMPGEVRDCFVKGQIHNTAEQLILNRTIEPVIIVGWDGQGPDGPNDITEFLDRSNGSWQMESFMVQELVPYIDRTYRTLARPEARALDGVSAGGYAAVNLIFKHPEVWKIGASHTGFFSPHDDADNMTEILGAPGPLWNLDDPAKTVTQITPAQNLHVYADIGSSDELSNEFQKFCAQLQAQRIDHACHVFPGRHTWEFWSTHFSDSLQFIDERFRRVAREDVSVTN